MDNHNQITYPLYGYVIVSRRATTSMGPSKKDEGSAVSGGAARAQKRRSSMLRNGGLRKNAAWIKNWREKASAGCLADPILPN